MKKTITLTIISCWFHLSHSQNVNQFTGSFGYNAPLLHVPSNRGSGVTIDANYSAGIKMNQQAGEIGLGWDLNAGGAIYRNVVGFPDDVKEYTIPGSLYNSETSIGQGALYPEISSGSVTDYDLESSRRGLDTTEFTFPGYDNYSVSGPALSGQMKPSYLKFYSYTNYPYPAGQIKYKNHPNTANLTANSFPGSGYFRKPQFHFTNDFADTIVSRHYPTQINSSTAFQSPTDLVSGNGYSSSFEPFIGKHLSGSTITNQNFNADSGRIATKNFVEYFTNQQITDGVAGLIDYQSSHNRSSGFPAEGIGYFRVTASSGLTYHYALPVYVTMNTDYNVPLDKDHNIATSTSTVDYNSGQDLDPLPENPALNLKNRSANKYAEQWLLTAVTGPEYEDSNSNNMADDGDAGYWVSYDYQLWNPDFIQRSPEYGFAYEYIPDVQSQAYPEYFPLTPVNSMYKTSGLFGSVHVSKSEVYYLSKIRTSSHTAIFVRDVRKDEKGGNPNLTVETAFKPTPDLLLKRIILFRNEDLDYLLLSHAASSFSTSSEFDFTGVNNSTGFYTEAWYNYHQASINNIVLKHVAFDQDYSLCKKYHGNINVSCLYSSILSSPTDVESNLTVSDNTNSGKLTLKRILYYGFQNVKLTPSIKFDYPDDSGYNPDFDPKKADYWGYYKYDATDNGYSRYTTTASQNYTKAWSLQKITDPLGGITEIEYESNTYGKVIDNECSNGVRGAAFIYRIKSVNSNNDITMEEGDNSANALTEFAYMSGTYISGLQKKVCIPYFMAWSTSSYPFHQTQIHSGFLYGDCSYSINPVPSGSSNNLILTSISDATDNYPGTRKYSTGGGGYTFTTSVADDPFYICYSGNGFLMLETPIGYNVYGGGIRVKKLKTRNANEVYVTQYDYEGGVATNEMDRFNYQVLKTGCATSVSRYDYLQPKGLDLFSLPPSIGYSKVTVQDLGRITNDYNGKVETTFITDPSAENGQFSQDHAIQTVISETTVPSGSYLYGLYTLYTINECINKFANIFGAVKETRLYDKNDNMLSKMVNEYEPTEQGASVENFHFEDKYYLTDNFPASFTSMGAHLKTVNILRNIPQVLKSTTTYGMGTVEKNEILVRDELTGETTAFRVTSKNKSASISYKIPAYKHYYPLMSVPFDFTSAAFRKILPLGSTIFTYGNIDSTLTLTSPNGFSSSFLHAGYKLYSNIARVRQYDIATGNNVTTQVTLPLYFNNRAFAFDAGQGSMDDFGLLKKSNLHTNPLNLSTINSDVFWEPGSTVYNWKLLNEATLLDGYKHTLEARDANNRFKASRFAYNGFYKSASAGNCNYASFTFADFENVALPANPAGNASMDGDMLVNGYNTLVDYSTIPSHTGLKCIAVPYGNPVRFVSASELSPGGTMETGLQSGRMYRTSVWVYNTNLGDAQMVVNIAGLINNSTPFSAVHTADVSAGLIATINNWNLLQIDFEVPADFATGSGGDFSIELKTTSGTVYFDDFILHPVESDFSASVYDQRNGRVLASIDANGLSTNYTYNAEGQVVEVWKEIPSVGYKQMKRYTYHYARGAND